MCRIKVHSKILDRLSALFAFTLNVEYNSLRGFDDSNKILCCYIASRLFGMAPVVLSNYYRIDERFMISKMEDVEVDLLVNDDLLVQFEQIKRMWKNFTENER